MTADATLPTSDDLTPEVLARKILHEVVVRWEDHGGNIERMIWRDFAEPLLSGVRSRDARIAEQDEEIATLRQQRHDALKRVTELELALDDRFEHSDHQSAKYYQRMRRAEISETAALARNAEAERILLGGIGQSWSRVVDRAIRALRGAEQ